LDDWSIENSRSGYPSRTLRGRACGYGLPEFQSSSFTSIPLLQYSNTPWPRPGITNLVFDITFSKKPVTICNKPITSRQGRPLLHQRRDLWAHVWPSSRGILTKILPLDHHSLLRPWSPSSALEIGEIFVEIQGLGIHQGIPVEHRPSMDQVGNGALHLLHVQGIGDVRYRNDFCRYMAR
jgi:hypothetical protein